MGDVKIKTGRKKHRSHGERVNTPAAVYSQWQREVDARVAILRTVVERQGDVRSAPWVASGEPLTATPEG